MLHSRPIHYSGTTFTYPLMWSSCYTLPIHRLWVREGDDSPNTKQTGIHETDSLTLLDPLDRPGDTGKIPARYFPMEKSPETIRRRRRFSGTHRTDSPGVVLRVSNR